MPMSSLYHSSGFFASVFEKKEGQLYAGDHALPYNCQKTDAVCAVLEKMAFEGHSAVVPVYYDTVLKTKYARDDISGQMIDMFHDDDLVTDIALIFNTSWGKPFPACADDVPIELRQVRVELRKGGKTGACGSAACDRPVHEHRMTVFIQLYV